MQIVKVEKNELVIRLPINSRPFQPSKKGKVLIIASSGGFQKTEVLIDKKPITFNAVAFIPKDA